MWLSAELCEQEYVLVSSVDGHRKFNLFDNVLPSYPCRPLAVIVSRSLNRHVDWRNFRDAQLINFLT